MDIEGNMCITDTGSDNPTRSRKISHSFANIFTILWDLKDQESLPGE